MQATGSKPILNKRLSIRISAGGFSLLTHSGERTYERAEFDKALRKAAKGDFNEVVLLVDAPSTRVPVDEFRAVEAKAVYQMVFGKTPTEDVEHKAISSLDIVELFPLEAEVKRAVLQYFPSASIMGFYGQAIAESYEHFKAQPDRKRRLYANVEGDALLLCSFSTRGLEYANTYIDKTKENRLYYVLALWSQLRLDQERDVLVFVGKDTALLAELKRYIRNVE